MAQNYSELRKDNVRDAIYEDVANNLEVLRTSWAGNAFPENPKVGQACYRIDEDSLYFWDGTTWSQKGGGGIDMNTGDKLYDWVGTLAEYKEQDIENQHPKYLCFITDDNVETKQVVTVPVGFIAQTVVPIDESLDLQKYANGQLIFADKFPELVNKLKKSPNLLVDEDTWQAEKNLSVFGQCGKFVLDEVAGTIRLPLIINAQGLTDLSVMGSIKNESLPNAKFYDNTYWASESDASSSLVSSKNGGIEQNTTTKKTIGGASVQTVGYNSYGTLAFSSSAYQNGAPVQQEAILYPYFIQVANEVDERLPAIREYKLNNPHFFGQSMYSDVEPKNSSLLVSNGVYHSGRTYVGYYEWLTNHIGETITANGGKIVTTNDEYTDYDWVVNTSDETFRLPLLNGSEDLPGDKREYFELLADGSSYTAKANGKIQFTHRVASSGQFIGLINQRTGESDFQSSGTDNQLLRVNLQVSRGDSFIVEYRTSGESASSNTLYLSLATGNGSLYFYVGDTVQDASLINAGAVLKEIEDLKQEEAKLKSIIRLVTELPEEPEEGVLYCIAEG